MIRWLRRWRNNLIYLAVLTVAAPWVLWRTIRTGKDRGDWWDKFVGKPPRRVSSQPCIWFHAVSVGEVRVLERLVDAFRQRHPDWQIAISVTTRAGQKLAAQQFPDCLRFVFPWDFSWAVTRVLRELQPRAVVLAELEVWPNLVAAAAEASVPVAIVNGRLSERSFRGYRRLRPLLQQTFAALTFVGAQTEEYAARFRKLGLAPERVECTGSLKFDGVALERDNPASRTLAAHAGVAAEHVVWLAGSTQPEEEARVLEVFQRLSPEFPQLRLILVPRHPEHFEAAAARIASSGLRWQRRSRLSPEVEVRRASWDVLLVDTIGELSAWWGTAQIAFVGGSFGRRGGQNMIEPAAYGAAVSFGPRTENFRDVVEQLLFAAAAQRVASTEELEAFIRKCLAEPAWAHIMGQRAQGVVKRGQGATTRTLDGLLTALQKSEGALAEASASLSEADAEGSAERQVA